ncbi:hypothetical protein BOTCAL_0393g00120 [Botryotinia calthae]|uniref:Uncharacterized protein n=1 Tax=Botryotinia calthae TaxID=38488 RepID=A0A4Y8CQU5_9HELO|nr:hypothetical protein BOTCAL_0393g00120 [Botryotinia calthae]
MPAYHPRTIPWSSFTCIPTEYCFIPRPAAYSLGNILPLATANNTISLTPPYTITQVVIITTTLSPTDPTPQATYDPSPVPTTIPSPILHIPALTTALTSTESIRLRIPMTITCCGFPTYSVTFVPTTRVFYETVDGFAADSRASGESGIDAGRTLARRIAGKVATTSITLVSTTYMASPGKLPIRQLRGENNSREIGTTEEEKKVVSETGEYSEEVASKIDQEVPTDIPSAIATVRLTTIARTRYYSLLRITSSTRPSTSSSTSSRASLRAPPVQRKQRRIKSFLKAIKEYWKPTDEPPRNPEPRPAFLQPTPAFVRPTPAKQRQRKKTGIRRAIKEYWKPSDPVPPRDPEQSWARWPSEMPPSTPTRAPKQKKRRESKNHNPDQCVGDGGGDTQMQMIGSTRNLERVAPEVGDCASERLPSVSSSSSNSITTVGTALHTSASISHNNLSSSSRTTMTTVSPASISTLSGSTQSGRVARAFFRMILGVIDRPAGRKNSNTSNQAPPLIMDRIMAFTDASSQPNLREAIPILQEPNERHSDTDEEGKKKNQSSSLETYDESSEESEASSSHDGCPGSETTHHRQQSPSDRQDEKDSGFEGSDGKWDDCEESLDQSDNATQSARDTNNESLNLLGGKEQKIRKRRVNTSNVFGGGFRSLGLAAAHASNGKRRKIHKGERKEEDVEMDNTDDADDEDSDSDMDGQDHVSDVRFNSFKGLLMNWDKLEYTRRH